MATMKELLAAYNEAATQLGKPTVRRFASQKVAEERTRAILKQVKAKPAGRPGRKIKLVDYPYAGELKPVPEGTVTAMFRDAIKAGATRADLIKILEKEAPGEGNYSNRITNRLRGLHRRYGYGIRQDGDTLKLVTR